MSIRDERELRDKLTGLLDSLEPRPAPVASAVRRGKGIRMRRWISVAVGLAVIVAGAALLPGLLQPRRIVPAGHPHYKVTVNPAGKHSPPGLIAYGTVNGRRWRTAATTHAQSIVVRPCGGTYTSLTSPGRIGPNGVTAFSGGNGGNGTDWCVASEVSRGITMIAMSLDNGATLELHPVSYRGVPLIAFALPPHAKILRLTAFEGARLVAYAIPFNGPTSPSVGVWLRPGQLAPAISSARLPKALPGPGRWTASVYVGPWGVCAVIRTRDSLDTECGPTKPQKQLVSSAFGGGGQTIVGTRADVAHVRLTLKNRVISRVSVIHLGGTGYFAVGTTRASGSLRWTAYNAAGRSLGSGVGLG